MYFHPPFSTTFLQTALCFLSPICSHSPLPKACTLHPVSYTHLDVYKRQTLTGSSEGLRFFLVPDFERMAKNGIGNVIFGAMSQAFFTLSIGMGGMAIFGSYLDKKRSLAGESLSIVLLDTCVALMAGLIVIPSCFAFGVEPDAGPGLVFITLPNIFTQMAGGRIWGSLFFLFLFCAALSTIVGVFENIVSFWMDLFGWKRTKAVGINIVLITVCLLYTSIYPEYAA